VGLKPTYGRVSRYGLVAFASSLDQVGTIARDVGGAALLLDVISGRDERDATSVDVESAPVLAALDAGLEGLRVGVPKEYYPASLNPEIQDLCLRATDRMRRAGATIVECSLPSTSLAIPAYYVLAPAEASSNLSRFDGIRFGRRTEASSSLDDLYRRSRSEGFGDEVKRRIMLGTYVLSAGYYDRYYGRALRARKRITQDFGHVFEHVDVLFTPTSPTVAFSIGERSQDPVQMYLSDVFTVTANLAGLPAISLPIGTAESLPVGGQFMGPAWREDVMVRAAAGLERALEGDVT
jgi:aspartyl-tRNA(Asn)/glutamyl-tRNA(Gln) amidotransferase subunit A